MTESYPTMVPVLVEDQRLLGAKPVGLGPVARMFGGKASAAECAIDWSIGQGIEMDPKFPTSPQRHFHFSKDYRARFEPRHIGTMLHAGLQNFWSRFVNSKSEPKGTWYWEVEIPQAVLTAVRARAFRDGKNPEAEISVLYRDALAKVERDLPAPKITAVSVPTDPSTRKLYHDLSHRCSTMDLDIDTLLVPALIDIERRPRPG